MYSERHHRHHLVISFERGDKGLHPYTHLNECAYADQVGYTRTRQTKGLIPECHPGEEVSFLM